MITLKNNTLIHEMEIYTTMEDYKKLKKYSEKIFLEFSSGEKREYMLCIDEVFSNSCIHAYNGKKGKLHIKYFIDNNYLVLKVKDFGIGIDEKCLELKKSIEPLVTSGRGLYILQNYACKYCIKKCELGGTEVTLYFKR